MVLANVVLPLFALPIMNIPVTGFTSEGIGRFDSNK
jgi:hypothetical protein